MPKIKVCMTPQLDKLGQESGINRVVEAYYKYLPDYSIDLVDYESEHDLHAVHAGVTGGNTDVAHLHGLYWTADYEAEQWEWDSNRYIVAALRNAKQVTVPSAWVAETIQRDMRFTPHIIGHGIEWEDWLHNEPCADYVLWNKNRIGDVCTAEPLIHLSTKFSDTLFLTTFKPNKADRRNVKATGVVAHSEMKRYVQQAAVYLATTKETFGIGILEAMAAGVPVLSFKHGAIVDLIQHGVNGYLAQPGNYDDLANGLDYCKRHRVVLGRNSQELVQRFIWDKVCEQIAGVYRLALKDEPATVSVIIPSYNYSGKVRRAIESAIEQTHKPVEIIVVDDGSQDDGETRRVVESFGGIVKYHWQENAGVANARNKGISLSSGKYICCIDADDAIAPEFLEVCVQELEKDRSLGIVYTGLHYILPDGKEGLSQWPGDFNYDAQLQRKNQIPTCCVYRREMWERLGGYKQRYAPLGAGEEDAEFWTRAGAYGWKAKKVTDEGLFIYSWQSGRVSGNKQHQMTDYLAWHPWAEDEKHPFASVATPEKLSHPVRQYDEPVVSVVIPVGHGHTDNVINALDSLEGQTFRRWECIIADDTGGECKQLLRAYPYVRYVEAGKATGAGHARNVGASIARAPLLLFLDADDVLYPAFLETVVKEYQETGRAIYTDYVGKAIVDDPSKLASDLQEHVYHYDGKTAVIGYRSADYDCERAIRQPEGQRPYLWCNITTLIPTKWHRAIGGFDESMPAWEDVDYWYRMARAGYCFKRIPEELMVYSFHSGSRREVGLHAYRELTDYMKSKYKEMETMGCTNCKDKKTRSLSEMPNQTQPEQAGDKLVEYLHPNRGMHGVIGGATGRDYGYRKHGDKFEVDARDIAAHPHWYRVIERPVTIQVEPEKAPEPKPIFETKPVDKPMPPKPITKQVPEPTTPAVFDLQTVPGISGELAAKMKADGVDTLEDVLDLGTDGLEKYRGVGSKRAKMILGAIEAMQKGV